MKIILSIHVIEEKIPLLKSLNWNITRSKIRQTIKNLKLRGTTKYDQPTAMSLVNKKHILRVVYEERKNGDIIFVITIHIARRGKYESTE